MKRILINFFQRIKTRLIEFKTKWSKKRAAEKKRLLELEKEENFKKETKEYFEKTFKLSVDKINQIIKLIEQKSEWSTMTRMTNEEYEEFLKNCFKENIDRINSLKDKSKIVFHYSPEIIDIHNESLNERIEDLSFNDIKRNDSVKALNVLGGQEKHYDQLLNKK